jgi:ribosomal protein L37AE/L43A
MLPAMQPAGAAPVQTQAAPVQAQTAPVPTCPQCGGPGVWHGQVGRWGCDRCRGFLDQMRTSAGAAQDAEKAAKRARGAKLMLLGGALCLVGIIITAVTHDQAEENGGGTYIIAYGPMIVGGIRFFQGLFMMG